MPRHTSDPLAVYIVPRLPRKSNAGWIPEAHRKHIGRKWEGYRDVHSTPWYYILSYAEHAKVQKKLAIAEGHRRNTGEPPEGHGSDTGGTPEGYRRDTGGTPGHTSDLGNAYYSIPATEKEAETKGRRNVTGGTPARRRRNTAITPPEGHRSNTNPTPLISLHCPYLPYKSNGNQGISVGCRRNTGRTTEDPLTQLIVPRLPRTKHY